MTRFFAGWVLVCTLAALAAPGFGQPQASSSLESVFAHMDRAASSFKALTADIRQLSHTEVVNTNEVEEGTIIVKRFKPKDTRVLIQFTKPDPKSYSIGGGKFLSFNHKSQEAQEADLGKSKDIVNQLMLLAFGSNSSDIQAAYTVKLGGAEAVNGDKSIRIELTPKSEEILKHVKRCDMWISDSGMTLQQKFFETGGDYVSANYTHMVINPSLPDSAVKLEIPKGIKITKLK